ncbi:peroxidase 18 [Prunus yedoensis var. nudiflora]|uniref:peroxidase n=1 Tax=Prunus yedoensis var. nudiflora TaxID=2094558 RepID=A0A315AX27_PRUYE|nr:peroxidase 18 [Prunus yedoensis var. nudiflora]
MEKRPTAFFYTHGVFFVWLCLAASASCDELTLNFYSASCPSAELMVRNTVSSASDMDPTIPGKLLRLLFHDCFVEAGGPVVQIPTGRRDGNVSAASNVRPNIVDTSFTMDEMIKLFSSKGLSLDDLVTLSGAHTIGSAHCGAFSDRFQQDSKGKHKLIDTSLDNAYAEELMRQCPAGAHRGLLQSDSVLLSDDRTRKQVESFAQDQVIFFESWAQSFLKLASIGVKNGEEGEIRASCSTTNA